MTLVEFLKARLDEDEQVAQSCSGPHCDCGYPARVLAEVEAKRKIVELIVPQIDGYWRLIDSEWGCDSSDLDGNDLLKALALPYADHADYDPAWRV